MEHVILDIDLAMGAPGSDIDDGFALALALADPDITIELVTTVSGNTDADTATTLTLELLDRLGHAEVPVVRGATRPLVRPRVRTGTLPEGISPWAAGSGVAAQAMIDLVRSRPGEITLVALGPLTNVALAMRLDPGFAGALKSLVIMGGVFTQHTHNAAMPGEFNVWCDPDAAAIVLDSDVVARWVGLDVTYQVRVDRAQALAMAGSDRSFLSFAGEYTAAWIDYIAAEYEPGATSCAMHDPLALATVSQSDLVQWRDAYVVVNTTDPARGVIICDFDRSGTGPDGSARPARANASVAVTVDADLFHDYFLRNLETLS